MKSGILLRRYKRFLADVRLDSGEEVVAHCPNPGRMTACMAEGGRVWLSESHSPKRKLRWTWEITEFAGMPPIYVLVHTGRINGLVDEALADELLPEVAGYESVRREVRCGDTGRRLDFLLEGVRGKCWVEVKSATMLADDGVVRFPDAVTKRGRHHLEVLADQVQIGERAVLLFVVPRPEGRGVGPADSVDPAYAETLRWAVNRGVEIYARRAVVRPGEAYLSDSVPVILEG